MKYRGLGCATLALFLVGCVHQAPLVVEHESIALSSEAEKVWNAAPLAPKVGSNKAIIRTVRGSARFSINGERWKKANVGTVLGANGSVQTDDSSVVDLFLGENGPTLRLLANSKIRIERLDLDKTAIEKRIDTRIELQAGRLVGVVKKLAAESKYLLRTSGGVIEVLSGEYLARAEGIIEVISGRTTITSEEGLFQVVTDQSYTPGKGIASLSKVRLEEIISGDFPPPIGVFIIDPKP